MNKLLEPGKYIVAVSGGVDSVALLHMLQADKNLALVVAHFDHGIRPDSADDARFVSDLAKKLNLPFTSGREELGLNASEALAREHRYEFLKKTREKFKADAIVTAHHQDDLLETALLNVLRGTKRRGLVSLKSTESIKRPLLSTSKQQIKEYARQHELEWREDPTNSGMHYKRNQIRAVLAKTLTNEKRIQALKLLEEIKAQDVEIEQITEEILSGWSPDTLPRNLIDEWEEPEAYELIAGWLRRNSAGFDSKTLERVYQSVRILENGAQIDVQQGYYCLLTKDKVVIKRR